MSRRTHTHARVLMWCQLTREMHQPLTRSKALTTPCSLTTSANQEWKLQRRTHRTIPCTFACSDAHVLSWILLIGERHWRSRGGHRLVRLRVTELGERERGEKKEGWWARMELCESEFYLGKQRGGNFWIILPENCGNLKIIGIQLSI